ncbi:MAG TPA: thioredoxin domain-containing protein [Candidatus Peribacteraceae bacterium]|nr:thioredoxin domain-containing protein [Candidatus Peribacteraceae bacterium]
MPTPERSGPERQPKQTESELYKALKRGVDEDQMFLEQEKVEAKQQKERMDLINQAIHQYEEEMREFQKTDIRIPTNDKERLVQQINTIQTKLARAKDAYDGLSKRLDERIRRIDGMTVKIDQKRKSLEAITTEQARLEAQATLIDRQAWDKQIAFFKQVINEYVVCTRELEAHPNDAELRAMMDKATAAMEIYRSVQSKLSLPKLNATNDNDQQTLAAAMNAMSDIHELLGSRAAAQSNTGRKIATNPAPRAAAKPAPKNVPVQPKRQPETVVQNTPPAERRATKEQTGTRIVWTKERENEYKDVINKAFDRYAKTVDADRKNFGEYAPWQAFEQDCRQHIQEYYEASRTGWPTDRKTVDDMNRAISALNATLKTYETAKEKFPKPSDKTKQLPVEHLDAHLEDIATFDWRKTAEKIFGKEGRIASMRKEFDVLKDSDVYKRFENTVSQYVDVYKTYAPNQKVKDEKMMRTIVWEMNQMIDAYDEALAKEKANGQLASTSKNIFGSWTKTIKTQGANIVLPSYFNKDMNDVDMRKSVIDLSKKEAFTDLTREQLDALLYIKTYLPELAGASPKDKDIRLNREDIGPISKSVRESLFKEPAALYERILKDQQIDPRSEEAKGLRIILNQLSPAERAEYEQQMAELRSAPAKLQQGQMQLNQGAQQLQRGYRYNRPLLNFLTMGAINRAVVQGEAKYAAGQQQYNDGWNRYQDGLRKVARLEKMRGDLPGMVEATIAERLTSSFDQARVRPSTGTDQKPRKVTEAMLNTFEDKLHIVQQIGDEKAKEKINELTGRTIEVYMPNGITMNAVEWMLQSHNKPVPMNGLPPELALWINPGKTIEGESKRMIAEKPKTRGSKKTDGNIVVDLGEEASPVESTPKAKSRSKSAQSDTPEMEDPFELTDFRVPQMRDVLSDQSNVRERMKKYPEVLPAGIRRFNTTTVDVDTRQFYWVTARDKNGTMLMQPLQVGSNQFTQLFDIQTVNGMQRITAKFDGVLSFTRFDRTEADVRVGPKETFENQQKKWWLPAMQMFDSLNYVYKSNAYKEAKAQNSDVFREFTDKMNEYKRLYVDHYEDPAVDDAYMMKVVNNWDLWMRDYAQKFKLEPLPASDEMIAMREQLKTMPEKPSPAQPVVQIKQETRPAATPKAVPYAAPQPIIQQPIQPKQPEKVAENSYIECQTIEQFQKFIQSKEKVIVKFGTGWCGPCRMMYPAMNTVAQKYPNRIMNADLETQYQGMPTALKPLEAQYAVGGYPVIIVFQNGQPVSRVNNPVYDSGSLERMLF